MRGGGQRFVDADRESEHLVAKERLGVNKDEGQKIVLCGGEGEMSRRSER